MTELEHSSDAGVSNTAQPEQPSADLLSTGAVTPPVKKAKAGFGGCLLYPLFFLVAQPLLFVVMLLQSSNSARGNTRVYWPYLIYDLILMALIGILMLLFFRKKSTLPAMFIFILMIMAILSGLVANLFWRLPEARVTGRDPLLSHFAVLLNCLILIPFFSRDDRTKNTFVREPEPGSTLDQLIKPVVPTAQRLYGWLVNSGKKVFFYPILFAAGIYAFDWLVDSIVLNVLLK